MYLSVPLPHAMERQISKYTARLPTISCCSSVCVAGGGGGGEWEVVLPEGEYVYPTPDNLPLRKGHRTSDQDGTWNQLCPTPTPCEQTQN